MPTAPTYHLPSVQNGVPAAPYAVVEASCNAADQRLLLLLDASLLLPQP
jgi:hypothetical protein